jgi:serine/threonine protein kinase
MVQCIASLFYINIGKKSLLKLFPKDYAVVMGQYENQILQEDRLETSVFLANGKSTEVYQGTFADLQPYNAYLTRMVAIKKFKDTTQTDKIKRYIELFVQLQTIDHPNVLKLIGISYGPQYNIVIVYPFFSEHDLLTYLKKIRSQSDQPIKIRQLFDIIWQVSLGMEAISHYGIVYKHLSSRTCLVNQELTIVLGDYSYSNLINGTCMYNKWRAPESITDNIYSEKTDVWSFGVTSWEILTLGDQPFEGLSSNEILAFVQNGHHLRRPTSCAWQLYEILKDCWSIQPHKRPDFNDIVSKLKTLKDDANFRDTLDNEVSLTGAVTPVCEVNYSLANGAIAVQVTAEDDDLFDEDGYIKVTPTLPVSSSIPS